MVQITEFRVVMPLSVAEYRIAQMYMVTKMQQENTSSSEGVEVLVNRPFKDDVLGEGQYTMKVYNLQSKFPSWITAIAPADCLQIEEEAWNAYPKCKTGGRTRPMRQIDVHGCIFCLSEKIKVLKKKLFSRFKLTIETLHVPDNGKSDNVHNLDAESLALRKVEVLDIASTARDYWNYMLAEDSSIDLSTFKPAKVERGPLLPGWQGIHDPVMTAYKLVTVDAPYWGFGYRMEQAILAAERALFLESHRRCFFWIDDWYGLSEEDVRRLEAESDAMLNKIRHGGSEGEREDETTRSLE